MTTTKFLRQALREDDVFLDVDANCGLVTLVAASTSGNGNPSKPDEAIFFTRSYPTNSVAIHSIQVERLNLLI